MSRSTTPVNVQVFPVPAEASIKWRPCNGKVTAGGNESRSSCSSRAQDGGLLAAFGWAIPVAYVAVSSEFIQFAVVIILFSFTVF